MDGVYGQRVSALTFEVLEPAPVGVAVTRGPDHRLLYTNETYRSLFGERPIGSPLKVVFPQVPQEDYVPIFDQVLRTGTPVVRTDAPGGEAPEDRERFFTFSLSRVSFDDGTYGVLAVFLDVTDPATVAQRLQAVADERRRILRRYQSLVRVSAQIVWVADPGGLVIEPSLGWERMTGQSWDDFRDDGWMNAVHPDDRAATQASWTRAVKEVSEVWEHVYRLRTVDGTYRHFQVRAVPIQENGRLVEWVGTCTDIEQQWQEQRRQRLLDSAAAATADRTSLEGMLGALANAIVPDLADGCGVHLVIDLADGLARGGDFVAERIATAARAGLPRLPPFSEERLAADSGFAAVVRRRRPFRTTFAPGSPLGDLVPAGTRTWLEATGANSIALLPVVVDGTLAAVVTAAACGDRAPIGQSTVALLREMIEQAHDNLSSAMRFQRTHKVAVALQHSLLAQPPRVAGMQIAARYRASPAAADVGGDWYDSFVLPDGATVLAIGDVAGHDLRAAVAMGQLRNMLRGLVVDRQEPPGEILARLNIAMKTLYCEETATCVLARVEKGEGGHRLNYAVAGHPPPLLITGEGAGRFLEDGANPLLGIPYDARCVSAREPLPPLSTLLLYTDGLVERHDEHLDEGLERLRRHACALARQPLDRFCDELLSALPLSADDDVAMIALRLPEPAARHEVKGRALVEDR
ncbi:SpoIIE family protein phosphatase [Nonomuraea sp. B1E8]|uniref:SpoIIE family protein phosphatase n=1 Tax=unclassified Nonomuraea TaxID=2593643 RepID=UPI00325D3A65